MDFSGFIVVGAAMLAGSFWGLVGGATAGMIWGWRNGVRIDSLEARVFRMHNSSIAQSGVDAKENKAARMSEAVAKLAQRVGAGEAPADAAKAVAAEYPDVAMDVLKKAMSGKLGGLGKGLIG